jgi:hypothetical protein
LKVLFAMGCVKTIGYCAKCELRPSG